LTFNITLLPSLFLDRLLEDNTLPESESEQIAEEIDEEIHSLQYKLDHCKRLLEGSEIEGVQPGSTKGLSMTFSTWVTDAKKHQIKGRLNGLKATAQHLLEHIREATIDKDTLQEMHEHMEHMDIQLSSFHSSVEKASSKWRRSRPTTMPEPELGDKIPISLVIPVAMDCFVDGLLIGITCALSPQAGIILGAANCLEMAFLGMAYATRIVKCTGSTQLVRTFTLYIPPLIMFLASGLGAYIAVSAKDVPAVYVAFVAFGVVALLALVCNELLIEANDAQGDDCKWWVNILIFAGIYLVLMLVGAF
jgi:zinc transporter ZupT